MKRPRTPKTGFMAVRHVLEYLAARAGFGVMRWLPYRASSRLFGALFAAIGPRLRANQRILDNLTLTGTQFPEDGRQNFAREVWRNFACTLVDLAHLEDLRREPGRISVEGGDILDRLEKEDRPVLFFSAHIACWEVIRVAAFRKGFALSMLYRRFNNPHVDAYARKVQAAPEAEVLQKGVTGARRLVRLMREKKPVLLLADQRFANGVEVDFLGLPAMTAPAIAQAGLKYGALIVPVHAIRTQPGCHKVVFAPPLALPDGGGRDEDVRRLLQQINRHIGHWVEANPSQWLWLHRRWKNAKKSD